MNENEMTELNEAGERNTELNNETPIKKPALKKCAGFSRKIGRTTYTVSCFNSEKADVNIETKVKRMIIDEAAGKAN